MSTARFMVGDVFEQMALLEDGSVDLILTSPPFLALRSYLPADHEHKHREIGSEQNPAAFVDTLLRLTAEWDRVLTPHGSIAIELGDTYSGAGGENHLWDNGYSGGRTGNDTKKPPGQGVQRVQTGWPQSKSLALVPELYRVGLAYGINPLTGEPSPAGRWRVRNVVRWHRPNPPVGALGDKFRPATSDLVVACKSGKRYFDLDAVREPHKPHGGDHIVNSKAGKNGYSGFGRDVTERVENPAGAPPLDTWVIPTHPYKGAHYATWPPELCVKPIKSMCPERVCGVCGEPSRRIVGEPEYVTANGSTHSGNEWTSGVAGGRGAHSAKPDGGTTRTAPTLGWSDCGHDNYRTGVVLDPFAGSGTTLMVATGHGRDAIGIDLDARNADLAQQRVGMFLTVEYPEAVRVMAERIVSRETRYFAWPSELLPTAPSRSHHQDRRDPRVVTDRQIAFLMDCHPRTVQRLRKEGCDYWWADRLATRVLRTHPELVWANWRYRTHLSLLMEDA